MKRPGLIVLSGLLLCLWGVIGWRYTLRPLPFDQTKPLFQGTVYSRRVLSTPNPLIIHTVKVDLTTPHLRLLVTPGIEAHSGEFVARTTSEFAHEAGLQVAINGSLFHPFYSNGPWDFYPHSGDVVKTRGLIISNGTVYSTNLENLPVLCLGQAPVATIQAGKCPPQTQQAIFGDVLLAVDGYPTPLPARPYYTQPQARTAVALDSRRQLLWLIVADGRQPYYSEGISLVELGKFIVGLGADSGLNLDGGGSTTMVTRTRWGLKLLNSPIHTRLPLRERSVATHLGVYVSP